MGSVSHQPEQRQDTRPGGKAVGERSPVTFELIEQPVEPIAPVIEGIVARQQFAGFSEQNHHQAHRHPARSAVDLFRGGADGNILQVGRDLVLSNTGVIGQELAVTRAIDIRLMGQCVQGFAMGLNQHLDRLAHALAEHFGELRLPSARISNRLQQT